MNDQSTTQRMRVRSISESCRYGGTAAKRASYRKTCGVEMGNSRSPGSPFDETLYHEMVADLDALGFWDQAPPKAATDAESLEVTSTGW